MDEVRGFNQSGSSWRGPNGDGFALPPQSASAEATPPAVASGDLRELQEKGAASRSAATQPQFPPTSGSAGHNSLFSAGVLRQIDDIARGLTVDCVVPAEPGQPQSPVNGIRETLETVDAMRPALNESQLGALNRRLVDAIARSSHSPADKVLLRQVVSAMTERTEGPLLAHLVAGITFERMQLPDLDLDTTGSTIPDSRYFNSALVPLAELAYDHDPAGRTLLWMGACQLFPGAGRPERLRDAMFSLPKDSGLSSAMDFYCAVDALNVDENVTDAMIEKMRRDAGGDSATS